MFFQMAVRDLSLMHLVPSLVARNYVQIEREALPQVFGVKRFHRYFMAGSFHLSRITRCLQPFFDPRRVSPHSQLLVCKDGPFFYLLTTTISTISQLSNMTMQMVCHDFQYPPNVCRRNTIPVVYSTWAVSTPCPPLQ